MPTPLRPILTMVPLLLALLGLWAPCSAANSGATPAGLWRTGSGAWLLLAYDGEGVWLWSAPDVTRPDDLTRRVPLVGPAGTAPLPVAGPIAGAACCLDGSDRLHLAWMAGGTTYYARCAAGSLAQRDAWHGPTGGQAPETVARGVVPRDCAIAAGARPMIAGERDGGIVLLRLDGSWRETFSCAEGSRPVLVRDVRRAVHLAFAGADGIRYHRSADGSQWLPREMPVGGGAGSAPALALRGDGPVVAGAAGGRPALAMRTERGWYPAVPWDAGASAPCLGVDRHGSVWCAWASGGWARAARWLGDSLSPAIPLGPGERVLLAEQSPPASAPDLGVLVEAGGSLRILRIATPGLSVTDERPARFLDLLDVAEMSGMVREPMAPKGGGRLPAPTPGPLLPGGIEAVGKSRRDLRAWFALRDGEKVVGYTAEWSRGRWSKQEPVRLVSPRPWLHPPEGRLTVIADGDEPDASRRFKMVAESAGPATSLLTSADGIAWAYYAGLPQLRPLGFVRDVLAGAEERWKVLGIAGEPPAPILLTSPDREHWYPASPPVPGTVVSDACFWNEEGMLLGLLNGGRTLVGGRAGSRLAPITELPAPGQGSAFAPPFVWNGRRTLFLAGADGWQWAEVPEGRWIGLRAAAEDAPGTCVTVPVALARQERRLRVDVHSGLPTRSRGGVRVAVLDAAGEPVPGYSARITRADGWREASWRGKRGLWKLDMQSVRLRFTVEPGARLYGFRFVE